MIRRSNRAERMSMYLTFGQYEPHGGVGPQVRHGPLQGTRSIPIPQQRARQNILRLSQFF